MREASPQLSAGSTSAAAFGPPVDDDHWVERARSGDVEAFEALYRAHVGRVYALSLRMCGEVVEAEEMTQTIFVRAWEKLDRFDGRSRFSSWLHRLGVNAILSAWRSRGRQRQRVVPLEPLEEAGEESLPTSSKDPATGGQRIDLERAIRALPKGARTVFVLHDIEGYRHREIAEQTGMAIGTCKAQLHRARRLLREVLASE